MDLLVDNRAEVEAHLARLGWIDADEPVLELTKAGEGNMNRTLRARLPGRTLILKQAVPYVAKYPDIPAPVGRLDAEAAFYRAIAGHEALRRHTPALLAEDPAEHLLCIEDLGEAADLTRWYADGPRAGDDALLDTLVDWLGELHGLDATSVEFPANLDMRRLNHAHIFEVPFDPGNGVPLSGVLGSQQTRLAKDEALLSKAAELGARYLAEPDGNAVLLHGDFYPGSWLEQPGTRVAVIDPEFGFVGPAEFDLGVLRAHLTFAGFQEDAIDTHLDRYRAPAGFDPALARAYAGIEIIRRLLGVAQLPLTTDDETRARWITDARRMMLS
jgi:5-methylthioribose kinase